MINLCREHLSPRLSSNILAKPNRDVRTSTSLENRLAVRNAINIYSVVLPSKESMDKIFGVSK